MKKVGILRTQMSNHMLKILLIKRKLNKVRPYYIFLIKIIVLDKGEEAIAENYDYKTMAKNRNLVFTKLLLNC